MAGAEQQTPIPEEECVNNGFDLLSEKGEGFPEFDEALKKELLDEAAEAFTEAGMTPQQIGDTISMWFPEDAKINPFHQRDVEGITILDIFEKYGDYYNGVDLEISAQAVQAVYDGYDKRKGIYVEEYTQIESDAHQGAIDCHLDVNREILQDYERRIRAYCKKENIPVSIEKRFIESLELAKNSIYSGDYEFVRDNFENIKRTMLTQIDNFGKRGMGVYATSLTDEQLRYLHGIGVALVRASLDDLTDKKDQ